jgi:hypothetical protein
MLKSVATPVCRNRAAGSSLVEPLRLCVFALNLNTHMTENQISKVIVDAAIEVHRELGGPGLIEDVYEEALEEGLRLGLVINFGERLLKTGIHRVVNGLDEGIEL